MTRIGIVTSIVGRLAPIGQNAAIDPLELTSEERASAHFVAETVAGRQIRVSLPRGTELQDGDVLTIDGDTAVVVKAKEEDLLLITPGPDPISWWAACYQLGNLHRPARFRDDGILTPHDPLALQILRGLDISVERIRVPFVGRRFGAAGAHHHHDDVHDASSDHGHAHTHDH